MISFNGQNTLIKNLRIVGIIEGISYLVLLFICMPLKYWANMPMPVKINGWLHGVLFVAYGILLILAWKQQKWTFKKFFAGGLASLIPFGTFWFDKKIVENKRDL
jgi:integral membrane protein